MNDDWDFWDERTEALSFEEIKDACRLGHALAKQKGCLTRYLPRPEKIEKNGRRYCGNVSVWTLTA